MRPIRTALTARTRTHTHARNSPRTHTRTHRDRPPSGTAPRAAPGGNTRPSRGSAAAAARRHPCRRPRRHPLVCQPPPQGRLYSPPWGGVHHRAAAGPRCSRSGREGAPAAGRRGRGLADSARRRAAGRTRLPVGTLLTSRVRTGAMSDRRVPNGARVSQVCIFAVLYLCFTLCHIFFVFILYFVRSEVSVVEC